MEHDKSASHLLSRRNFIGSAAITAAAVSLGTSASKASAQSNTAKFKMKYAPHFGMFEKHAGKDLLDQLQFMSDEGFTAMEDNGMMNRDAGTQKKIGKKMEQLGMEMGVFVSYANFKESVFVIPEEEKTKWLLGQMKKAVEVAKRVNAKWSTVVPGCFVNNLEWDYQTANCIETLKKCAAVLEPSGLVMVLEPLNRWNHPGLFLTKIPQAYQICKAVNSPSCKILDDLYHQQITEGNLIPNLNRAWSEIAYFQMGDNPGRKEPTTGEINYKNIFKHLHARKFNGILGMEHGNSIKGKAGERAVIDAYRECDNF